MSKVEQFLKFLESLRKDRGAMAALRRALTPDSGWRGELRAMRYVEPFLAGDLSEWYRSSYYLVAGLFALHPHMGEKTLAQVVGRIWSSKKYPPSLESRFLALLESDTDQLAHRLKMLVQYVASQSKGAMGFDYARLLDDVIQWRRPDQRVQRRWAREFYSEASRESEATPSNAAEVEA